VSGLSSPAVAAPCRRYELQPEAACRASGEWTFLPALFVSSVPSFIYAADYDTSSCVVRRACSRRPAAAPRRGGRALGKSLISVRVSNSFLDCITAGPFVCSPVHARGFPCAQFSAAICVPKPTRDRSHDTARRPVRHRPRQRGPKRGWDLVQDSESVKMKWRCDFYKIA